MLIKIRILTASIVMANLLLSLTCLAGSTRILEPSVSFQAVHRIGADIWASGTQGAIFHSPDNGLSWGKIPGPADSAQLQFRDIQPLGNGVVMLMSAGEGQLSRVYRSDDDGQNWHLQLSGTQASTFYDCMHFSDQQHGWLYGDSDAQGLFVLSTSDAGKHWQRETLAIAAQEGEGGFASSGSCVNQGDNNILYIGTGNSEHPRILGRNNAQWFSLDSPFSGTEAAGIFSLQQAGEWLYAFGGSLKLAEQPAAARRFNLLSKSWADLPPVRLNGAIYGSALITLGATVKVLIANPEGVAVWQPGESDWQMLSQHNIWSLACDSQLGCIGVGKDGLVELFDFGTE